VKLKTAARISRNVLAGVLPGLWMLTLSPVQRSSHADFDMSGYLLPFVAAALAGGIPGFIALFEGLREGVVRGFSAAAVAAATGVIAWLLPLFVILLLLSVGRDSAIVDIVAWIGNAGAIGWASAIAVVTARAACRMPQPSKPRTYYISGALGGLIAGAISALINWAFELAWGHDESLFVVSILLGSCTGAMLAIADTRAESRAQSQGSATP